MILKIVMIVFARVPVKLVFVRTSAAQYLPPGGNVINLRNQALFSLSLRASAHTGVAIRSPYNVTIFYMLPRRKRIATSLRSSQ